MQENKKNKSQWSQVYKDKMSTAKRHTMRLYLQYLNPKLSRVFANPRQFVDDVLPENAGMWLVIAAICTALLVFTNPDLYWKLQPIIFLIIFFGGSVFTRFLLRLKGDFNNLLVAYPGKHLLHQEFQLDNPIVKGYGEVSLDGELWKIRGEDCDTGDRVRVIAINKSALFVSKVS